MNKKDRGLESLKHLYCVLIDARATCFRVRAQRALRTRVMLYQVSHVTTTLPPKW